VSSRFKGVAVMTDDKSTISSTEEYLENIGIFSIDPSLKPYKDHFKYRLKRYADQKKLIEEYEGGVEEFAKGGYDSRHCFMFVFLFYMCVQNNMAAKYNYLLTFIRVLYHNCASTGLISFKMPH